MLDSSAAVHVAVADGGDRGDDEVEGMEVSLEPALVPQPRR